VDGGEGGQTTKNIRYETNHSGTDIRSNSEMSYITKLLIFETTLTVSVSMHAKKLLLLVLSTYYVYFTNRDMSYPMQATLRDGSPVCVPPACEYRKYVENRI
jgi:hypothetical protein